MIVNFIGSPLSGKSTIASLTYSKLKRLQIPTDYVSEYARYYISKNSLKDSGELTLEGQLEIFKNQLDWETCLQRKHDTNIVISDSSPLNSLLYMDSYRNKFNRPDKWELDLEEQVLKLLKQENILYFLCYPIMDPNVKDDPNRIHSREFSVDLHTKILTILQGYVDKREFDFFNSERIFPLVSGDPDKRAQSALAKVHSFYNQVLESSL